LTKLMIETHNLYYNYQNPDGSETPALKNINLKINKGEFVAIIGHNGSGKSTLAKHFNALLLPTKGDVFVKGINTRGRGRVWEIRQIAGMVFQNPDNQLVAAVVEEDVAFGPENLGIEPQKIRERVREALKTVEMEEYATHAPHLLSGGQKQRVAIAGVIAMRPECIILDEPTAMLDPSGRREVLNTVKKLNREEGITVVHITHFMEEAVEADRVIVMEAGEIIMDDKPIEVFSRVKELKALGLDVPQVTELAYNLHNKGFSINPRLLTVEEMVMEL